MNQIISELISEFKSKSDELQVILKTILPKHRGSTNNVDQIHAKRLAAEIAMLIDRIEFLEIQEASEEVIY